MREHRRRREAPSRHQALDEEEPRLVCRRGSQATSSSTEGERLFGTQELTSQGTSVDDLIRLAIEKLKYDEYLRQSYPQDYDQRWENVQELVSESGMRPLTLRRSITVSSSRRNMRGRQRLTTKARSLKALSQPKRCLWSTIDHHHPGLTFTCTPCSAEEVARPEADPLPWRARATNGGQQGPASRWRTTSSRFYPARTSSTSPARNQSLPSTRTVNREPS